MPKKISELPSVTTLTNNDIVELSQGSGSPVVWSSKKMSLAQLLSMIAQSTSLLSLSDTPDSYAGQTGKVLVVNATASGIEFVNPLTGATTFVGLTDTPADYTGQIHKLVRVNGSENGLEFVDVPYPTVVGHDENNVTVDLGTCDRFLFLGSGVTLSSSSPSNPKAAVVTIDTPTFLRLPDTPDSYAGQAGKAIVVKASADGLEFAVVPKTFLQLTDTPADYTGQIHKLVRVNGSENGLEFVDVPYPTVHGQDVNGDFVNLGTCNIFSFQGTGVVTSSSSPSNPKAAVVQIDLPPLAISGAWNGKPPASTVIVRAPLPFDVNFRGDLPGQFRGVAEVAATSQADFAVVVDGATLGWIRFAAGATVATFVPNGIGQVYAYAGDVVKLVAPVTPDATLADLGFTFLGVRT